MREPRINVYVCEKCHGHTVTVDVDEGVTPFMIGCHAKENESHPAESGSKAFEELLKKEGIRVKARLKLRCDGVAYSSFYPRGPKPSWTGEPKWEWYKPEASEMSELSRSALEHVDKGGLLLRKRTNKAVIMHPQQPEVPDAKD